MTLSPYVIFSTWFTFHVYQGHSDEENATFVRALYRYISGCFADNSCALPSFDFNLSDLTHFSKLLLFMTSIKSPGGLRNFLPEDYLICVKACSKMTFILGMLKSIVCGLGTGLAMCTWERCKLKHRPISYQRIAAAYDPNDWYQCVDEHKNKDRKMTRKSAERRKRKPQTPTERRCSMNDDPSRFALKKATTRFVDEDEDKVAAAGDGDGDGDVEIEMGDIYGR